TRWPRDWSSVVCSSDLLLSFLALSVALGLGALTQPRSDSAAPPPRPIPSPLTPAQALPYFHLSPDLRIELVASEPQIESPVAMRSEERRVGKEGRSRWA